MTALSPAVLAFLAVMADNQRLRAELAEAERRRTLGGIPPKPDKTWANARVPPPPSATDPDAPPLRRPGFASSGPYPSGVPAMTDGDEK